jgi:hypothetical protein
MLEEQVIATFERDEPGSRDQRREQAALLVGNASVVARMKHQRRRGHPGSELAHIDLIELADEPHRVLRRG